MGRYPSVEPHLDGGAVKVVQRAHSRLSCLNVVKIMLTKLKDYRMLYVCFDSTDLPLPFICQHRTRDFTTLRKSTET